MNKLYKLYWDYGYKRLVEGVRVLLRERGLRVGACLLMWMGNWGDLMTVARYS